MASSNSAESFKRKGNFKKRKDEGSGSSRSEASASPRSTRPMENQEKKFDNVLYYGTVLFVNYEKKFGKLTPNRPSKSVNLNPDDGTRKNDALVFFRVVAPGAEDQSSSTMTGGMPLMKGDTLEYVLHDMDNHERGPAARRATLCKCKDRKMDEVVEYVKSLLTTAQKHPDIVLRSVTRCPAPLEYVLNYNNPSSELVQHTLVLCQTLQRSKLITGVYRSKLKQMYTLFCGSRFLLSETGVTKHCCRLRGGDESSRTLLKDFLVHLLTSMPSQLPQILPLLCRLGACEKSGTPGSDVTIFEARKQILSCEGGNFLMKILNIVAGGRSESPGSQPCAQLPLLPTMEELVKLPSRGRNSTLPVVREKEPYISPEDYIDTYFRLLREDCFAGLLQGIQAYREGKLDDRDMKMWIGVSTVGVHFNHTSSPGLTFAVRLPQKKKGGKARTKNPDYGSLVCFSDDGGSFDSPIWCVVRRCEEDADKKSCICFVDIVVQNGDQIELTSANSMCMQCARLMKGEGMAMAESPTAYYAYQPVLEALQLTDPQTIPFKEELVSVTCPRKAPDYLKSASTTLDWSCIFEPPTQGFFSRCLSLFNDTGDSASGEIREGVGGVKSLAKQGYTTSFDECQLKAIELAVTNRLTIIQGPPGTGKTYIACKLLQLLLSASTFPEGSPILVITFKNHALDQFLEKCLAFCKGDDSIVRVGSRSKNEALEKYNLKNKETRNDEFRFEFLENIRKTKEIQQSMESALKDFNECLQSFDPLMVIAPGLQLHFFIKRLAHPDRVQAICARTLLEGSSLAEVLILDKHPEDADPGWVTDILWLKQSLVAEIRSWIPKPEVLKTAKECFSAKKPLESRPPQRVVSAETNATVDSSKATTVGDSDEEQDDKEEQERRSAYESLRQDTKLEDLDTKSAHGFDSRNKNQWSQSETFMEFSKKRDVHQTSAAYALLDLDESWINELAHGDPYHLSPGLRAILVYKYWQMGVDVAWQRLASIKAQYDTILQDTEEISKRRKLAIFQKAKIIGITTTGAAMHQSVLKCLSPAVILVEEAAEILEPNVLAVLNPNLQHLILIGDHEQLRPTVASYPLDRWHGFSVSMFERLVKHNKLPFQHLSQQCRMREEFVPMLRPIYPFLKTHTKLVSGSRNKAPTCMVKTMYFWAHSYQEKSVRSYENLGEAEMVVALARWIVSELQNPQGLTILAAYGGQVTTIQKMLEKYADLKEVEVHTIDRFQGSENEIVIVSLVRSNPIGKIGYLSDRSRLCVAASRARAGVYFVGNNSTLAKKSADWRKLIQDLDTKRAMGDSIPLCCPRHPSRPPYALENSTASIFEPRDVCNLRCEEELPCGHACTSTCHTGNHSLPCQERVPFTFRFCGHTHTKLCHQDHELELSCKTVVTHKFETCKHSAQVKCREIKGNRKLSLACKVDCGKTLQCGHPCALRCSDNCEGTPCHFCAKIEKEKERLQRELIARAIEVKQKELELEIQKLQEKANWGILVHEIHPHGDKAEAFFLAKERVEKLSIQPDSKTAIEVTKVEKIENLQLQQKFLEAQRELINPLETPKWLFYGGPDDLLDQIVNKGFNARRKQVGCEIFDVYSSTAAEELYGKLLLCEVHLGKTWRYGCYRWPINVSPEGSQIFSLMYL
ncbi:hypothetical protein M758_2G241900 [Ceratodon purpureus]|nr:hypothetical protein M758_2G241900 [Ceratodon purpureus]